MVGLCQAATKGHPAKPPQRRFYARFCGSKPALAGRIKPKLSLYPGVNLPKTSFWLVFGV
jgi:hypothetical protein